MFKHWPSIVLGCAILVSALAIPPIAVPAASQPRLEVRRTQVVSVSEESKAEIQAIVKGTPEIVALQVITVDFIRNERTGVYFFSSADVLNTDWNEYRGRTSGVNPLFSSEPDEERRTQTNTNFARVMNGDFVCIPWSKTAGFRVLSDEFKKRVHTLCLSPIPPDGGAFAGYFAVYFSGPVADTAPYEKLIETLSASVYRRDVKPK